MNYIRNIWSKYWVGIILMVFIVLFFGKIAINTVNYHEYLFKFAVKCKAKGGVMFVPHVGILTSQ